MKCKDLPDGRYLYRDCQGNWWWSLFIEGNYCSAPWRTNPMTKAGLVGVELIGPLSLSDPDWVATCGDAMGRLFRDPRGVPFVVQEGI